MFCAEGISGTEGRDGGPGLDALLKDVARREFDVMAAWPVYRLGRSLYDLIGLPDYRRGNIPGRVAAVLALSQGGYSEALHGRATPWN